MGPEPIPWRPWLMISMVVAIRPVESERFGDKRTSVDQLLGRFEGCDGRRAYIHADSLVELGPAE